jgi:DNA-binding transcriptional ArsR family regulator
MLDRVFHALSDATRREILLVLRRSPGATTTALAATSPRISRWAVMKHLSVLRQAGLVQTLPEGSRRRHYADERGLEPVRAWLDGPGAASGGAPRLATGESRQRPDTKAGSASSQPSPAVATASTAPSRRLASETSSTGRA